VWIGSVEWECGLGVWIGSVDWECELGVWIGSVDWECGLGVWIGSVDWEGEVGGYKEGGGGGVEGIGWNEMHFCYEPFWY